MPRLGLRCCDVRSPGNFSRAMVPSTQAAKRFFDTARSVDTAHSYMDSVVSPVALLLALRWADAHDAELEAIARFNGEEYEGILPRELRWEHLRALPHHDGRESISEVSATAAWNMIRRAIGAEDKKQSKPRMMPRGRLLRDMIAWVDGFPFDTPADRRVAGDAFSELVLESADRSKFGGEFTTPFAMGRLIVALAGPEPGERIYDPCFGTGGLLVQAASALWERGRQIAPGEWSRSQRVPLFGVEKNSDLHLVGLVRLLLAGVRPALELGDALERDAAGRHHDQGFDCVLADPPWGLRVEGTHLYDFPIKGKTAETLFVQHAVRSLRPEGRAVIAVPPSVLFRGGPDRDVRRLLMDDFRLEAVIQLPANARAAQTSVTPTLLLVRRASPRDVVRLAEVKALPESDESCRRLVDSLMAGRSDAELVVRSVGLSEIAGNDYFLEVGRYAERETDAGLDDIARLVPLRPLGEIAELVSGVALARKFMREAPAPGAVAIVRVSDVANEGPLLLGARYLLLEGLNRVKDAQLVRRGDVLLTIDATIGRTHYVRELVENGRSPNGEHTPRAVVAKGVLILRTSKELDPRLLHAILKSETMQSQLKKLAAGAHILHLPLASLRKLLVPVPPVAIQERVMRRLAEQPGDALEVLSLVLRGHDDDELARLFREHPAFIRLSGDGDPDLSHRGTLAIEVLEALKRLRNRIAHPVEKEEVRVALDFYPWLMRVGSLPFGVLRSGSKGEDQYEALSAAAALLESAVAVARSVPGLLGRQAARLTERLITWAQSAQQLLAADVDVSVREVGPASVDGDRRKTQVEVSIRGQGALRPLKVSWEEDWEVRLAGESQLQISLAPKNLRLDSLSAVAPARLWVEGREDAAMLRLVWDGTRLDGASARGASSCVLALTPASSHPPPVSAEAAVAFGASPYVTGDVVDDPAMFFGRRGILDDVRTHIGGGTKVILLEGNRRTGKTSILRQLQRPEYKLLEDWVPIECSFQGTAGDEVKDGIPTRELFRLIVRDIGLACSKANCPVPLPGMEVPDTPVHYRFQFSRALNGFFEGIDPYEALQIYVDMVIAHIAPRRLLLMLDEFDKLQIGIDNHVTSPQVPENIRNLLQTRAGIAAIITGSRRLKRLREEYWSALFGFGHRIGVDPLEVEEARELITRPVANRLSFDAVAVESIIDLTARQPFLMQSLCARVFELAKRHDRRRVDRAHVEEAVRSMVEGNEHFQALWSYAQTERRRFLLCLCHELQDGPLRVSADLLAQQIDAAGIHVPVDFIDDDLKFLIELEIVKLTNTELGPNYSLAIPLLGTWMTESCDCEAQRRRAVYESEGGR